MCNGRSEFYGSRLRLLDPVSLRSAREVKKWIGAFPLREILVHRTAE